MKLTIELVPKTAWYENLRSELSNDEWDKLRKETFKKANYTCEICGGTGPKWPVECHEIWDYDDENKTQTLKGLIALCPSCHEVKHIGLARVRGNEYRALQHLERVNNITKSEAEKVMNEAFDVWNERSKHEWTLDLTWLEENK